MSRSNTAHSYGSVAKTFHWLTALLIITLIALGIIANGMAQLEFQDTLTDKLAYLFSTEIENSGSYYENGFQNTEAFYFAIASLPDSSYHFDLSVDYFHADYTENFGINRPTQALIDRGLYQTGSIVDTNGDGSFDVCVARELSGDDETSEQDSSSDE